MQGRHVLTFEYAHQLVALVGRWDGVDEHHHHAR